VLSEFWLWLETLPIAAEIGATWWFPFMESLHVLSLTIMLGAILMLDLRVLGWAALRYSVSSLNRELVPWSAAAFLVANVTGVAMFITRASHHVENPAFQIKMLLLLLAGVNIAYFHFRVLRTVSLWDSHGQSPLAARVAAASSLMLWIGVTLAGRWIGHIV
jgi:hypothetical protein